MKKYKKYQDLVIHKGKFIGEFELMYKSFKDPWKYKQIGERNIDYKIIEYLASKAFENLKKKKNKISIVDIGCGHGMASYNLAKDGFNVIGTDISKTIISKAKRKYKHSRLKFFVSDFDNYKFYKSLNPDIFLLSNISWYVLPKLKNFIKFFKKKKKNLIIHCLAFPDNQKYGKKYFYDEKTLINFFNLNILCKSNIISKNNDSKVNRKVEMRTYFLGKNY